MNDEKKAVYKMTPDNLAGPPDHPWPKDQYKGCLFGCLGLFIFYVLSMATLATAGGWAWWHLVGLTVLFFVVRALTRRAIVATVATAAAGIIAILVNLFFPIEKPLHFDHIKPQKSDLKVMRELFRVSELPPSFKIAKVHWHGADWFPSQGLRTAQFAVDVDASDLSRLLAKVSDCMKPAERQSYDFFFMMDDKTRDSFMLDESEPREKRRWKNFKIEIKEKLDTIRWSAALAWDEQTSPALRLYICVIPEFQ